MGSEVWVDSSAFFALLNPRERGHAAVKRKIGELKDNVRFVTSDYVLDETITLLQARGLAYLVEHWIDDVVTGRICQIVWMDSNRFDEVRAYFVRHSDKQWSFTDCFSFCVMRERKIRRALATDHHFTQAGFEPLLAD